MALTNKQRLFVEEYLSSFNATQAAKAAGYSEKTARSQGQRLLTNADIAAAVRARIEEKSMTADETLLRLADIARGDIADLLDIHATGYNLALQIRDDAGNVIVNPQTRLIRKIRQRTTTVISQRADGEDRETTETEIELYNALDALQTLAKHHALLVDRTEHTGEGGGPIVVENVVIYIPDNGRD